ncbi:MAG TPA: hypothetical protein VN734_04930 [Acidobacteriaceae bacterium]|nr:hypothetical protein [Acidobacteriaceae bacterium]
MKLVNAAALLAALTIAGYAHGDPIVAGSVSNSTFAGGLCSSAAASSTSVSLNCGSGGITNGLARVSAAVGSLDASMQVFLSSYGNPMSPGMTTLALTNLSWGIDGTYILIGGSGYGYVDWSASSYRYGEGGGGLFGPCSITLNGLTENCDLNSGSASGSFLVPYNTPVSLIFGASYAAGAMDFDQVYSGMNFAIDGLKTVDPSMTPEPPTWTLVALAAGIILLARTKLVRSGR